MAQDKQRPDRLKYYYRLPKALKVDEQYEPEIVEIKDVGLTSAQTKKILGIDENRLAYLLRHGPLWRVPSIGEDGKPRRFRRISIKSIIDYIRMQDERGLKKFADYWQI